MTTSLNVIALISGGKDSLFSILHCLANGHTVVALANLYPPTFPSDNTDDEDLNSFMYQTVGHTIIPFYEEALGIPLYRQEIRGSAVNAAREYAEQDEDETESLVPLLEKVMQRHPLANAVSTGAIFSTYQRTRVENVAVRLGLVPLAFLWQFPVLPPYTQSSLLCDMRAVGQDARIIKVASAGLDESFLWENVADSGTVKRMMKGLGRFSENGDGALVGEGGEFETLAVDGPSGLWKGRIVVEGGEDAVVVMGGGTAVWRGKGVRVEMKEKGDEVDDGLERLRIPELFDDEFSRVLGAEVDSGKCVAMIDPREPPSFDSLPTNTHTSHGDTFTFTNITGETSPGISSTPQVQLTNILLRLHQVLQLHHVPKEAIAQCTLLVRDMSTFSTLNTIYAKYFSFTTPPARITVAVGTSMPKPFDVILSITAHKDTTRRTGLHIQSQSYWAPANIGPYSQAISVPIPYSPTNPPPTTETKPRGNEVYIAGQIPLVPATMALHLSAGFQAAATLSLQHLWRIGRSQRVRWWTAGVAMIPHSEDRAGQEERVLCAQAVWKGIHAYRDEGDEEVDVDPWDRQNFGPTFEDRVFRAEIPDFSTVATLGSAASGGVGIAPVRPPCFVVEVEALPRYAQVEWACLGLAASDLNLDLDLDVVSSGAEKRGTVIRCRGTGTRYFAVEILDKKGDGGIVRGLGMGPATLLLPPSSFLLPTSSFLPTTK
ncbi:adenine nucleotide alpha hydrolases-like protein [Massarina eburnea CBS 473.64]|uniref:Diphthine--ammonia ligase n=1 Tax=Massarina eburnea CBS 473.64 TaxID=1395130 RepID=A0A6A6SB10_9PLEO|nr:adenine nucleotide alpha hydrolases-like protein [Massarina eburnea CBS 473.64]